MDGPSIESSNLTRDGCAASSHAEVCWVFSLARCGCSIVAYAAAAPWQVPVADEPFGPWDRTGEPYNYPPEQDELRRLYWDVDEHITPQVANLATRLFDKIAGRAGRVVSKHPHDMIKPEEFARHLPEHKAVFLLRNPLKRLNSLYVRGWLKSIGPNHDLPRFKLVAQRWLDHPHRFTFEQFRADAPSFFGAVWEAWGWSFTDDNVARALDYCNNNYHASSAKLGTRNPARPLSEKKNALPVEAVELYLSDPFIVELMESNGWSTDRNEYV